MKKVATNQNCPSCKARIIIAWYKPNSDLNWCADCAIKQFDNEQKKALKN